MFGKRLGVVLIMSFATAAALFMLVSHVVAHYGPPLEAPRPKQVRYEDAGEGSKGIRS